MSETLKEHSWIPLVLVACASFIITLDATFMNVSISKVVVDLHTDVSTIQMIMSFYTLITAAFMLLSTKLQDIVGKKKLFIIGTVLYGIGTFTAAISWSTPVLFIGWALIEGIAGALMTPATVSLISGIYSGEKRTFALAIESVMVSISAAVGPLFGGVMTTFLSWRWGFAVELIFVIFILVMQHKIPDFKPTESKNDLDITGTIISVIGLVLFVWGILMLTKESYSVAVIVLGLVILAIFAWFEIRRKRNGKVPLLDMDLFKDRNLRVGAIIRLIGCLAMGGALFAVSLFLQSVMQLNALNTGLTTLPMTIGLLLFAIAAPSLSTKFSHKTLIAAGSLIAIAGCLILSYQFRLNTTMYDLIPGLFVLGAGLGFVMSLSTDISLINIPKKSENNASGVLTTTQTLGESMGTAIIGVILILGVMGGLSTAINMYAPDHANDPQFFDDAANYLQAAGTENITQDSTVMNAIDVIIQEAMGFVMIVTAILLAVVFIATLRLEPKKQ